MSLLTSIFYYLAAASVISALLAVTRRNPVHSMLWVLALFLHVGGIFLFLGAEFLAAVQVIVYAGAILVFYLFVVMLMDLPDEVGHPRFGNHWPLAAGAGACFAAIVWIAQARLQSSPHRIGDAPAIGSLADVGAALFGPFAFPFELISLVLLAAIVGAVVLARKRKLES